jgi:hypothetical protein
MSSRKPTTPMDAENNLPLPLGEISSIIEACGKAGVRVLKYRGLYLALGPAPEKQEVICYPLLPPGSPLPAKGPDHARQNADTLQHDEEELRAEQLRMLMIENPMEYERQLRDGELTDEPAEQDDGEA